MADSRVYNFSAGPCALPAEVLQTCADEMLNWHGSGMGVMEMSHRGKDFVSIYDKFQADLRDVLQIPATHKVFLQQGGATLAFASIPMNMMGDVGAADYLVTGQWGEKAHKEAAKFGEARLVCNTKASKFTSIPPVAEWALPTKPSAYVHYCANETVNGVEFHSTPEVGDVPLVADMSSNFISKPIEIGKHAVIYAGAQKNLGPAGNTVFIVDEKYLDGSRTHKFCPTYCDWKTCVGADSMYNTPNTWGIYVMGLYLDFTKKKGGISYWDELATKKSRLLYDAIDGSDGFYTAPVAKENRSRMNVPFQIQGGNDELEKKFLAEAKSHKLVTLAGHRSVGGCRASLYNGMPLEGVQALVDFMKAFAQENAK